MNGTEQRQHRSVTDGLAARLDEVEAALERLHDAIGAERTHRLKMADEQHAYVDRADLTLEAMIGAVRDRSFWERLRWLLLGD